MFLAASTKPGQILCELNEKYPPPLVASPWVSVQAANPLPIRKNNPHLSPTALMRAYCTRRRPQDTGTASSGRPSISAACPRRTRRRRPRSPTATASGWPSTPPRYLRPAFIAAMPPPPPPPPTLTSRKACSGTRVLPPPPRTPRRLRRPRTGGGETEADTGEAATRPLRRRRRVWRHRSRGRTLTPISSSSPTTSTTTGSSEAAVEAPAIPQGAAWRPSARPVSREPGAAGATAT